MRSATDSMAFRLLCASGAMLAVWAIGCDLQGEEDAVEFGELDAPIIGGVETDQYPAVVSTRMGGGSCTGTVVASRLVLTAAHCVINANSGSVRIGSGPSFETSISVDRHLPNRNYRFGAVTQFDIAFSRLAEPVPDTVEFFDINLDPLTEDDLNQPVRVVGFGVSDGASQTGGGRKREVALNIDELTSQHIGLGTTTANICQGDSGGPTLRLGGTPTVLAVSSFGSNQCRARSFVARTDVHVDFIREVVSAWGDGPCALDGECGTGCEEFGDPDCDSCALDGVCATGCPRVDLDCPLGGSIGDDCVDDDGCESRACVTAMDDSRVQYCSQSCNGSGDGPCPVPFVCNPSSSRCEYVSPTPGTQGAACNSADDCRSNLCDTANEICAEPCGGDSDCSGEFVCLDVGGTDACTLPGDGGCGCQAGSGASNGAFPPFGSSAGDLGNLVLLILLGIGYGAAARLRRRKSV